MNKIQARNMLIDVVEHFSKDPEGLRSVKFNGRCVYNPPKHKPKSIGCAIGMYINTTNAKKLDKRTLSSIGNVLKNDKGLLPKWMLKLDKKFLIDIQRLHDYSPHWYKSITDSGKRSVNNIIKDYELGEPYFTSN